MVKGNMDLLAIDNLMKQYDLPRLPKTIVVYDIAFFNDIFRKLCNNAQLEKTYHCIIEKNLLDPELKQDLKKIFKSLVLIDNKLVAHNPLVDSFYTLIVGLTMYNNNNNKLQIGGGGGGGGDGSELIDKINKFEVLVTKIIDKFSDKLTDQYILDTKSEKIKEILKAIKLLSNKDTLKYFDNKQLQQDNNDLEKELEQTSEELLNKVKEVEDKDKEIEELNQRNKNSFDHITKCDEELKNYKNILEEIKTIDKTDLNKINNYIQNLKNK
jgi:hypothetical protein